MPDFSIDQIIAGGAGASTRADFSKLADLPKAYYEGRDQAYNQKLRNAFSDDNGGLPVDAQGNFDAGKAWERLIQLGGAPAVDAATKLAEAGFQQDRYRNAPTVEAAIRGDMPASPTTNFPPSANRSAPAVVAPPLNRGGVVQPQATTSAQGSPQGGGDKPGSLMGFLSNWGVPEDLAGNEMNILGGKLSMALGRRVDPNQPLNMNDPTVRGVLGEWVRARGSRSNAPAAPSAAPSPQEAGAPQQPVVGPAIGRNSVSIDPAQRAGMGVPQPQAPQPYGSGPVQAGPAGPQPALPQMQPQVRQQPAPAQVSAPPAAEPADPTLGGLVPAGYEPGAYVRRLEAVAGSGRVLPDQLKVLQGRIEAIHKALEPTPDMKNARAAGMSVKDYLDRSDTNMADRDVLTKSILPKLDKSQEAATAARDEIQAIHRSREQLDAPGGIFSGAAADVRLKVAKVAEFLGVPNADKIANTESFGSAIGSRVLSLVKGLGAGTGISNADRDFAAAMAGGNIKLDEKSIRKILDIGEKAARTRIDQHNGLADRTLKSTDALKGYSDVYRVEQPGQYQRAGAAPPPQRGEVVDGHRFLGGNPRDPRAWGSL
jgi:hypothetical protein